VTRLNALLHARFPELPGFRPGQLETIEAVIQGRDVICVLPTGGGKTLIYQLAGAEIGGTTIVATPLLALMQDQVRRLRESNVRVGAISGSIRGQNRVRVLEQLVQGRFDFCFATPEQLARDDTRAALVEAPVGLMVVDEAHCISEWGFDFRPAYRALSTVIDLMGRPPVLAMTATAPEAVRRDVGTELLLDDPLVVARGFDRPNLHFSVVRVTDVDRRDRQLADVLRATRTPAIVYCTTRREAEETARALFELQVESGGRQLAAGAYHGGMERSLRREVQQAFLEGQLEVLCATSAFGMGIDHPDIRTIVHRTMPDSVEAYWQEVGRAGRDGLPTDCVLMYRREDRAVHEHLHRRSRPSEGTVARMIHVVSQVEDARRHADVLAEMADQARVARSGAASLLEDLERFGYLERQDDRIHWRGDPAEAMEDLADHHATQVRVDDSRLTMLATYAEHDGCRRRFLLDYLGDEYDAELCLRCDECLREASRRSPDDWDVEAQAARVSDARSGPFARGEHVTHHAWGRGTVQRVDGDVVVVRFDDVGYRSMHAPTVMERGLLDSA
jgi:ATP-dependent DNA helicase RecQ